MNNAAKDGRESEVRRILEENKEVRIDWTDFHGWTVLHHACLHDHDQTVSLLLAHPDIEISKKTNGGSTPFFLACSHGALKGVRLLLKEDDVFFNDPRNDGRTPLWRAAFFGHHEVIRWWIASGRAIHPGRSPILSNNALGIARMRGNTEVVSLLERFRANQTQTRHDIRKELGWFEETAAEVFALVVFFCDGLLDIEAGDLAEDARFFRMARELPMDLQMVLCYRVVESTGENIPGEQRGGLQATGKETPAVTTVCIFFFSFLSFSLIMIHWKHSTK